MTNQKQTANENKKQHDILFELKQEVSQLAVQLTEIQSQLAVLTETLVPEEEPELGKHLQKTIDAITKLDKANQGVPISRFKLANELRIHENTAYVRAEKLVKLGKIQKYYGRSLGKDQFEEKKAVYYGLPHSIYQSKFMEQLEHWNKDAHSIALTLLQNQPLGKRDLLDNNSLSQEKIDKGLDYLIQRGLIFQQEKDDDIIYRIRKVD